MKLKHFIKELQEFATNCEWGEETDIYVSDPVEGDCENVINPKIHGDERYRYLVIFGDFSQP